MIGGIIILGPQPPLKVILILRSLNTHTGYTIELTARFILGANLSLADVLFPANQKYTDCMRPSAGQALQLALFFT